MHQSVVKKIIIITFHSKVTLLYIVHNLPQWVFKTESNGTQQVLQAPLSISLDTDEEEEARASTREQNSNK